MDFIGEFLQDDVKHGIFVKLDSRYVEEFPEYVNSFGLPLSMNNSMYGMTNYGKLFANELTNWLIDEAGFKQSKCEMSI